MKLKFLNRVYVLLKYSFTLYRKNNNLIIIESREEVKFEKQCYSNKCQMLVSVTLETIFSSNNGAGASFKVSAAFSLHFKLMGEFFNNFLPGF